MDLYNDDYLFVDEELIFGNKYDTTNNKQSISFSQKIFNSPPRTTKENATTSVVFDTPLFSNKNLFQNTVNLAQKTTTIHNSINSVVFDTPMYSKKSLKSYFPEIITIDEDDSENNISFERPINTQKNNTTMALTKPAFDTYSMNKKPNVEITSTNKPIMELTSTKKSSIDTIQATNSLNDTFDKYLINKPSVEITSTNKISVDTIQTTDLVNDAFSTNKTDVDVFAHIPNIFRNVNSKSKLYKIHVY